MKQTELLTHCQSRKQLETSCLRDLRTSHNFSLFHVSNLSVLNCLIFLLMCPGPVSADGRRIAGRRAATADLMGLPGLISSAGTPLALDMPPATGRQSELW